MASEAEKKEQALTEYRNKLQKHKEIDTKVRALREAVKELKKEYDKTEDDLKALQVCHCPGVGQWVLLTCRVGSCSLPQPHFNMTPRLLATKHPRALIKYTCRAV
jgi:hypothetical protein